MLKYKKHKKVHLGKKLLWTNTFVVLVVCLSFFVFFSINHFVDRQEQTKNAFMTNLDSKTQMFEQIIELSQNTASNIKFNSEIIELFNMLYLDADGQNNFVLQPSLISEVNRQTLYYMVKQDFISRICIYNKDGDFTSVGSSVDKVLVDDYVSTKRVEQIEDALSDDTTTYMVYSDDELSNTFSIGGYVSIIQEIKDYESRRDTSLGYVEVQISVSSLKEQLGALSEEYNLTISHGDTAFLTIGENKNSVSIYSENNTAMLNEFIVSIESYDYSSIYTSVSTIIVVGIAMAVLVIILFWVQRRIIKNITTPIIDLCENIQLDKAITLQASDVEIDEIEQLYTSFAGMQNKLQQYVQELVAAHTGKIKAQMLALQAQINPHFIHNTLAINSSLIEEGEYEQALKLSARLSSMIRYTCDYTKNTETLYSEFKHIEDYLQLIKIKYEEDFCYEIDYEEEVENLEVPKFILQPLIENAIVHGFKNAEYPWAMRIKYNSVNDIWYVEIYDKGTGISEDEIQRVKERFELISTTPVEELLVELKNGGYSLMNTLIRMHLHYKEGVIFDIKSNKDGGTTVILGGKK